MEGRGQPGHPSVRQYVIQRSPYVERSIVSDPSRCPPDSPTCKTRHKPQGIVTVTTSTCLPRLVHAVLSPLRPVPLVHVVCQLIWCIFGMTWGPVDGSTGICTVLLGFLSVLSYHEVAALLLYKCNAVLATADWLLVIISSVLNLYHLGTGSFLDYNVVYLNAGLASFSDAYTVFSLDTLQALIPALVFPVLLWAVMKQRLQAWYARTLATHAAGGRPVRTILASLVICLVFLLPVSVHTCEPLSEMLRSLVRTHPMTTGVHAYDSHHLLSLGIDVSAQYPLLHEDGPVPAVRTGSHPLPHILVVVLESFGSSYLFKNCSTCNPSLGPSVEYTPHFNAFARQHTYSNTFYGNTVQSARSYMSIICGMLPSWRHKIFSAYPSLHTRCLPRILREVGYQSLFWNGQGNLGFDNQGTAARGILGFDRVEAMNARRSSSRNKKWGMGWQDDETYRALFKYMDEHVPVPQGDGTAPWFTVVTSISHHRPFDHMPEEERRLYKHRRKPRRLQWYEDSLHASDRYFGVFLSELQARPWLEDAIVIVVGDHAFPNGEHGTTFNEIGGYEENFRVPLAMRVPSYLSDRLQAGEMEVRGGSQVDLAPTLLDMLGVHTRHHHVGTSLLGKQGTGTSKENFSRGPTILVQPYDGIIFVAVRWPYKLRLHLNTITYHLTKVDTDVEESTNLFGAPELARVQAALMADLVVPLVTQQLVEGDRIYPDAESRNLRLGQSKAP